MSEGWPRGEEDLDLAGHAPHGEPDNQPDNHRAGQVGWLMYEWANQPYFSLITIFLFANYFANVFYPGDEATGQAYWGYTQAIAGVAIALMSPVLGAMADAAGPRKPFIALFLVGVSLACIGLWSAVPGGAVLPVMALIILASISAEFVTTFANAMLPTIATERRMALLSGAGFGIAQVAGIVALALVLFAFQLPGNVAADFIPDAPLLGLDRTAYEDERIVGPLAGLWFLIFMLPLFLLTPDQPKSGLGRVAAARQGIRQLGVTFRRLRHFRNIALYLIARMLYYDGCAAGAAPFSSTGEIAFLTVACLFGLGVGPVIASSRTMLARLAPREMMAEFFGLYALAGKATTFLAPLTIGIVTQATGNQRLGLSIVLIFLVAGLALMLFVREERSRAVHA